jgi:hypothetical protein
MFLLDTAGLKEVPALCRKFGVDFDDAYQYLAAHKYSLTLVSFDSDFDRTERGRNTPAAVTGLKARGAKALPRLLVP